jgi:hypothetical protein
MLSLLERNIAAIENRLLLLAPPSASVPTFFRKVTADTKEHLRLVREMQRLRGSVYLDDGAVERAQLSDDGLHQTPEDKNSWHLLMRNPAGRVSSCAWYMEHQNAQSLRQLRARTCPLGRDVAHKETFQRAVQHELDRASAAGLKYAEVGGWAVAKESRCTAEGLVLALAAYSLGRAFGGALGLTTATVRHSSSTILRRLGGSLLQAGDESIPPYYDPHYQCDMELLRFDSRRPSAKYVGLIDRLQARLATVTVVAAKSAAVRPMRVLEVCAA